MKKSQIIAAVLLATFAGVVVAETPDLKEGMFGLSIPISGTNGMVSGKYLLANDVAVFVDLGVRESDTNRGGDEGQRLITLGGGLRKYLKLSDVSPFIGGGAGVTSSSGSAGDFRSMYMYAQIGAEAFLLKHFSIEGAIGLRYHDHKSNPNSTSGEGRVRDSGTDTFVARLNFYF